MRVVHGTRTTSADLLTIGSDWRQRRESARTILAMASSRRRMRHMGEPRFVPTELTGMDGEPPVYVLARRAATTDDAVACAVASGLIAEPPPGVKLDVRRVLMREMDPIRWRIRGKA